MGSEAVFSDLKFKVGVSLLVGVLGVTDGLLLLVQCGCYGDQAVCSW